MEVNDATEIRKLPHSNVKQLAQILELNDSWKNLMAIIPKVLEKNNYECGISRNNPCKYHSEHFKLLENASLTMQKMCTELLFSEWGTSAKVRPALGHLLHLLTKAQLYRAADYVAETLLRREPPARPSEGPAAAVTIVIPDVNIQEVEQNLDAQNYHSSIISNLENNPEVDINLNSNTTKNVSSIPKIIISEPERSNSSIAMPLVTESRKRRLPRQNASAVDDTPNETINTESDMIKFTRSLVGSDSNNESSNSSGMLPNLSVIMSSDSDNQNLSESPLPALSELNINSENEQSSITEQSVNSDVASESAFVPQISLLISSSNAETSTSTINSVQSEENTFVPQLSVLLPSSSSESNFLPVIDLNDVPSETSSFGSSQNSKASSNTSNNSNLSRPKCVSPLPNLSLNTPLPHFSYCEVEEATNKFNDTPHKNCRQVENSLAKTNGRFLGSGAFGSVFLGLEIIDKPVAVKKLILSNMDVVDVDDPVTKQFKNEVEILSKYKHENLLSLVGYSCDGPTYCLLYEFMPGGALKDRLQNLEEKLIWTDRLYIALGTARAVSYLHTAYNTPLIHRDIKTANILLDCANKPKLGDFGLIKLISNQNTNTSTSAFGTSAYMAREAFWGDVSVKLDTYSFGVVLLELITGLPPLDENREGCDIVSHVEEVCEDDSITPLIDLKAGSWIAKDINFAEELYKISTQCLEYTKKKRPTMVAIKKQLTELINRGGLSKSAGHNLPTGLSPYLGAGS